MSAAAETKRKLCSRCGFTLLELMIVITIILVLATLAAGRYDRP